MGKLKEKLVDGQAWWCVQHVGPRQEDDKSCMRCTVARRHPKVGILGSGCLGSHFEDSLSSPKWQTKLSQNRTGSVAQTFSAIC